MNKCQNPKIKCDDQAHIKLRGILLCEKCDLYYRLFYGDLGLVEATCNKDLIDDPNIDDKSFWQIVK